MTIQLRNQDDFLHKNNSAYMPKKFEKKVQFEAKITVITVHTFIQMVIIF